MHKQELLATLIALLILVGLPVGVLAYRYGYEAGPPLSPRVRGDEGGARVRVIDLIAHAPEAGGWSRETIRVQQGQRVRLRIRAEDVVHGFAIGQLGVDAGEIKPGEVVTVDFVPQRAGRYTYYCNVWCSPNHWRMRGTLEVVDPSTGEVPPDVGAAFDTGGLDVDAPHPAAHYPARRPAAQRGAELLARAFPTATLPAADDLRAQSPSQVFAALRAQAPPALSDDEVWDVVAALWAQATTPERLAVGAELYGKNCVGCHGATGRGDGPGAAHTPTEPVAFANPQNMAGGTGQIYHAKMRRGGMGTGMPYWGPIFTDDEAWSVVEYLWTSLFDLD